MIENGDTNELFYDELQHLLLSKISSDTKLSEPILQCLHAIDNDRSQEDKNDHHDGVLAELEQLYLFETTAKKNGAKIISNSLQSIITEMNSDVIVEINTLNNSKYLGPDNISARYKALGIDIREIPQHYPTEIQFDSLSKDYLQTCADIKLINHLSKNDYLELLQSLQSKRCSPNKQLQSFIEYQQIHHLKEIEGNINLFFKNSSENLGAALYEQFIREFDLSSAPVCKALENLYKLFPTAVVELLVRANSWLALKVLTNIQPEPVYNLRLQALLSFRFNAPYEHESAPAQKWLSQQINERTGWQAAQELWSRNQSEFAAVMNPEQFDPLNGDISNFDDFMTRHNINSSADLCISTNKDLTDNNGTLVQEATGLATDLLIEGTESIDITEQAAEIIVDKGFEKLGLDREISITDNSAQNPAPDLNECNESSWDTTIWPFIKQNIVVLLAPASIFAGILLLVFSMWDQEPFVRFALAPLTIVASALGLSKIAQWLQNQDIKSDIPVAILQSVSVFLAPMSFLIVAVLYSDPEVVSNRHIWGIGLSMFLLISWYFIFKQITKLLHSPIANIHARTLLYINCLVLLLPATTLISDSSTLANPIQTANALLVTGFYFGFIILMTNFSKVFVTILDNETILKKIVPIFYTATCLGSFITVWTLIHIYINALPQVYTYGPLLVLLACIIFMLEHRFSSLDVPVAQLKSISYLAISLIVVANVLCMAHPIVRSITLFLTGAAWFIQARKRDDQLQYEITLGICSLAAASLALLPLSLPDYFTWIMLVTAFALLIIYLKTSTSILKAAAAKILSPVLMLSMLTGVAWQYTLQTPALSWGVAFAIYGLILIYLATREDSLYLVHTGVALVCVSLPYWGFADIAGHALQGNTMVFGLSIIGALWLFAGSLRLPSIIRDSRSSVLWSIATIAMSLMILHIMNSSQITVSNHDQYLIMLGPVLMSVLMVITGFYCQSYLPIGFALVIMVLIFPEIKDHYGIAMRSGLGSSISSIIFIFAGFGLSRWNFLQKNRAADMIWRVKQFPLQAAGEKLFSQPLYIAAFFLMGRVIFWTYPVNISRSANNFEFKTIIALVLSGFGFQLLSAVYKKHYISYIGIIAIFSGIVHASLFSFGPSSFFWSLIIAWLVVELTTATAASKLKRELFITVRDTIRPIIIWAATLCIYPIYSVMTFTGSTSSVTTFGTIAALLTFALFALKLAWTKQSRHYLLATFFMAWQVVAFMSTSGSSIFNLHDPQHGLYLATSIFVLAVSSLYYIFETSVAEVRYRFLSILKLPLVLITFLFSTTALIMNYTGSYHVTNFVFQMPMWVLTFIVLGRFTGLSLLWLYSLLIAYISISGAHMILQPLNLALFSIALAILPLIDRSYPNLFKSRYQSSLSRLLPLSPNILMTYSSLIIVSGLTVFFIHSTIFSQSLLTPYLSASLALLVVPAFFSAPQIGTSKRFLVGFTWLTLLISIMFCLKESYPLNIWITSLMPTHLIAVGLALFLATSAFLQHKCKTQDTWFNHLRLTAAISIIMLIALTYMSTRNIDIIPWQRLIVSGFVCLVTAVHLRFYVRDTFKSSCYGLFATALTMCILSFSFALLNGMIDFSVSSEYTFRILCIPPAFFVFRTEWNRLQNRIIHSSRIATTVLLYIVIAFYVYQPLFQLIISPGYDCSLLHYTHHSLIFTLAGIALCRMHFHDADINTSYLGIAAIMSGSFFLLTSIPLFSLSPEVGSTTVPSAINTSIMAVLLSLGWILSLRHIEHLKLFLLRFFAVSSDKLHKVQLTAELVALIGSHIILFFALTHYPSEALVRVNISLLIALWLIIGHSYKNMFCFNMAFIGLLSLISISGFQLWQGLILYCVLFLFNELYLRKIPGKESHFIAWNSLVSLIVIIMLFSSEYSQGIRAIVMTTLWVGTLSTPLRNHQYVGRLTRFLGALTLYIPALILLVISNTAHADSWGRFLIAIATTTALIQLKGIEIANWFSWRDKKCLRLIDAALNYLNKTHSQLLVVIQVFVSVSILFAHTKSAASSMSFGLILILHLGMVYYWWIMARKLNKHYCTLFTVAVFTSLVELLLVKAFADQQVIDLDTARMFTWLAISFLATAAEPFICKETTAVKTPIKYSLLSLPLLTVAYALRYPTAYEHLPLVIMLYSVLFTWKAASQHDRFTMGYAFIGYNSWLIMMFFRNDIHSVQAYLIPCCITVLVLVQLFRDRTSDRTANIVRGSVLLLLLGYAIFDAIIHNLHSPIPHITLIIISIVLIATSVLLRIKIFAIGGLMCFTADILALIALLVINQEPSGLRVIMGSFLLVGGGILMTSFVLYKKHKERIDNIINSMRNKFTTWE